MSDIGFARGGEDRVRPEAVEAAAKALHESWYAEFAKVPGRETWEKKVPEERAGWTEHAEAAIRAFLEAEGLTVERQGGRIPYSGLNPTMVGGSQRLVSPWRPVVEREEER